MISNGLARDIGLNTLQEAGPDQLLSRIGNLQGPLVSFHRTQLEYHRPHHRRLRLPSHKRHSNSELSNLEELKDTASGKQRRGQVSVAIRTCAFTPLH